MVLFLKPSPQIVRLVLIDKYTPSLPLPSGQFVTQCLTSAHLVIYTINKSSTLAYMATMEALNSPTPATQAFAAHRRDLVVVELWPKSNRSKPPHPSAAAATEEKYFAFCLIMLASGGVGSYGTAPRPVQPVPTCSAAASSYRCSLCHKAFPSYQAFGDHKASHDCEQQLLCF